MEASEEILLNSLANWGVPIPAGISSVGDLTPPSLFSLCSSALRLIDGRYDASSFPASLPEDSMPDKVKICTELAHAFNKLGYNPELSFHKFLYPSEEDLYKIVRFLVGKLSESSGPRSAALGDGDNRRWCAKEKLGDEGETVQNEETFNRIEDLRLKTQAFKSSDMISQDDLAERAAEAYSVLRNAEIGDEDSKTREQDCSPRESNRGGNDSNLAEGVETLTKNGFRDHDSTQNQGEVLKKPMVEKHSNLQHPDEELQLLKTAVEMVFDDQNSVKFHLEQLNGQVEAKRHKLKEMESEWHAVEKALQEKRRNLDHSLLSLNPDGSGKLMRTKEIELETESVLDEIRKREEELSKLSSDFEKQPKLTPRRSYIERVKEITKNSRKQDNDIQQILKETRELQLESNTIQERLNRTYAVVDETIFRGAKKDPVARQGYRLLTNIHESFGQISEKILATDRTRREAADYEAKLVVISTRSLNMGKLQADLDAIRKQNELLEQRLHEL